MMRDYSAIPEDLRRLNQWVGVRYGSKMPISLASGDPASCSNPSTWSNWAKACLRNERGSVDYLGFVFNRNGIVAIDIDCGFDDDGFPSPLAIDIIRACDSYTERSKSGRGYHILVKGQLPWNGKNNLRGVEIYQTGRYFILTGETVGTYTNLVENQDAIDYILETYFSDPETEDGIQSRIYNPRWDWEKGSPKIRTRPNYPDIPEGCRNICLTSLGGHMHSVGYSRSQILDELRRVNADHCDPPMDDSEVRSIVTSVCRYRR